MKRWIEAALLARAGRRWSASSRRWRWRGGVLRAIDMRTAWGRFRLGLRGREFRVGAVRCLGTRLCPPCEHLRELLKIPDLLRIMHGRGGLRATLLEEGTIRVGDEIVIIDVSTVAAPAAVVR